MQLKRDTDYAIRILYCLRQNGDVGHTGERKGMTLSEIAMQTGTPKLVAGRVCESLKEKGMIAAAGQDRAERSYCSTETQSEYSLLDVIEAVEGTCQLFTVFDKRFAGYKSFENQIRKIQKQTEGVLAGATLGVLFEMQDKN